jgi:hypothetical protein
MFTYVVIAAAVLLIAAAIWVQAWGRDKPGRHISQNAPTDDPMNARAKWQHDSNHNSPWNSGGVG